MKKICCFVFLVLCVFFKLFAEDDDKLRLAVMEFEDRSGTLSKQVLSDATEYLRGALISANKYTVIATERQNQAMIKDMKKESYKECNDKNCQIQLGQALSADTILRTTITRLGQTFVIASELIDLAKEATVVGAREKYDGTENSLSTALDNIAEKVIAAYESIYNSESSRKDYSENEEKEVKEEKAETQVAKSNEVAKSKNIEDETEAKEKLAQVYSNADERMDKLFTGRYKFGILANFDSAEKLGLSTGLDFNFNVFRKPYGSGAGNLYVGFGFDFQFYLPIEYSEIFYMTIPVLANIGYDFRVSTYTLRYVGFWFSLGGSESIFIWDEGTEHEGAFAWELGFDMIFRNRFILDLGFGGDAGSGWHSSYFFLNIGTVF